MDRIHLLLVVTVLGLIKTASKIAVITIPITAIVMIDIFTDRLEYLY